MFATDDPESLLGGPLELPGGEQRPQLPKPHKAWLKKLLIILGALVVAGLLAFGGLKLSKRGGTTQTAQPASQPETSKKAVTDDTPDTTELKTFKSTLIGAEIAYPADWTVEEKDGLHITSPSFTFQSPDKGEVKGTFKVYMRQTARPVDGKYIGNAVAVEPSTKLTYSSPGTSQRKETSFTNFGAGASNNFSFFMITGDFSLKKDDTLGPNYGREAGTYIIVGGWSGPDQKDDLNFESVAADGFASKHAYQQAVTIVKSLKLN